jgi:hypothetical protein
MPPQTGPGGTEHMGALQGTWVHFGNWGWFGIACPKLAPVVESKWGCFGATGSTMGQEWYKARSFRECANGQMHAHAHVNSSLIVNAVLLVVAPWESRQGSYSRYHYRPTVGATYHMV